MRLKSYFSTSVEAAMEQARRELGDDALLVNARPAAPEARYLGAYEVVFGLVAESRVAVAEAPAAMADAAAEQLKQDLAEMRRQIERLSLAIPSPAEPYREDAAATPPEISPEQNALLQEELTPEIAQEVCGGVPLDRLFTTCAQIGKSGKSDPVVALVGPPGVGKTATLIKLAVRYGLAQRRPVRILSAGYHRVAGSDQLRALAALLGITCDVVETATDLTQGLRQERGSATLTLIDTPGFSIREMPDASELAAVLSEVDVHLTLSASSKYGDLQRIAAAYACFRPQKLLFTRVDETSRYGALVNLSALTGLPISFLSTGQMIPDDLEEATSGRISELVLGERAVMGTSRLRMGAAA